MGKKKGFSRILLKVFRVQAYESHKVLLLFFFFFLLASFRIFSLSLLEKLPKSSFSWFSCSKTTFFQRERNYPTDRLTILEPQSPSIVVSELNEMCQSADFEVIKFWTVKSCMLAGYHAELQYAQKGIDPIMVKHCWENPISFGGLLLVNRVFHISN